MILNCKKKTAKNNNNKRIKLIIAAPGCRCKVKLE